MFLSDSRNVILCIRSIEHDRSSFVSNSLVLIQLMVARPRHRSEKIGPRQSRLLDQLVQHARGFNASESQIQALKTDGQLVVI